VEISEKEEMFIHSIITTSDYWWVMQKGSFPMHHDFVNHINLKVDKVSMPAQSFLCD